MKKQPTIKTFVGAVLFALLSQSSLLAQDAHVSLWIFDSGDLSATAGSDLEYIEDTGDLAVFGTTEALGIPAIGGEVANVLQLPKLGPEQGLRRRCRRTPMEGAIWSTTGPPSWTFTILPHLPARKGA